MSNSINISKLIGGAALVVGVLAVNAVLTNFLMTKSHAAQAPMVVTVNSADMLMGFVASRDPGISDADIKLQAAAFNRDLDGVLARFAQENNLLIVNSAAVVSGAQDVTPAVLRSLGMIAPDQGS